MKRKTQTRTGGLEIADIRAFRALSDADLRNVKVLRLRELDDHDLPRLASCIALESLRLERKYSIGSL